MGLHDTCGWLCLWAACPLQFKSVCLIDKCYRLISCDRKLIALVRAGVRRSWWRLTADGLIGFYSALQSFSNQTQQPETTPMADSGTLPVTLIRIHSTKLSKRLSCCCRQIYYVKEKSLPWILWCSRIDGNFIDFPHYPECLLANPWEGPWTRVQLCVFHM